MVKFLIIKIFLKRWIKIRSSKYDQPLHNFFKNMEVIFFFCSVFQAKRIKKWSSTNKTTRAL